MASAQAGFFSMCVPEALGGAGLGHLALRCLAGALSPLWPQKLAHAICLTLGFGEIARTSQRPREADFSPTYLWQEIHVLWPDRA